MTQMEKARDGRITREMKIAAKKEAISAERLRQLIAKGEVVIPANKLHKNLDAIAIGAETKTKINANIGSSPHCASLAAERKKMNIAIEYGADTVMDLSTGGNLTGIRKKLLEACSVPFGTVPIYQAAVEAKGKIEDIREREFVDAVKNQMKEGVDFVTIHSGITRKCIPLLKDRTTGVVSRGGAFLVRWMKHNKKENPLYENFDEIIEAARKYDVTLSLGDGLRPGSIGDASDKAQIAELKTLGKLTKKAWKQDVQVIIEGPGHLPLNQIEKNIKMQKKYCMGAPFYVLGPIVTDVAPGYDHITSAIGGALAAYYGADFLCYVTPAEHLRLPDIEDIREGVIASRIAAHAADVAKGIPGADQWDRKLSKARKNLDWDKMFELAMDSKKARKHRAESGMKGKECTMCGEYCSMK